MELVAPSTKNGGNRMRSHLYIADSVGIGLNLFVSGLHVL